MMDDAEFHYFVVDRLVIIHVQSRDTQTAIMYNVGISNAVVIIYFSTTEEQ